MNPPFRAFGGGGGARKTETTHWEVSVGRPRVSPGHGAAFGTMFDGTRGTKSLGEATGCRQPKDDFIIEKHTSLKTGLQITPMTRCLYLFS